MARCPAVCAQYDVTLINSNKHRDKRTAVRYLFIDDFSLRGFLPSRNSAKGIKFRDGGKISDGRESSRRNQTGNESTCGGKAESTFRKAHRGVVQRILTNSPNHPHGIKVMLESGIVGR